MSQLGLLCHGIAFMLTLCQDVTYWECRQYNETSVIIPEDDILKNLTL